MKIAIYYPWLYLRSGAERVILELIKRSEHEYTILTNHFDKDNTFPEFDNLNVVELKNVPVNRNLLSVAKAASIIATQKIDISGFDALFVLSDGLGDLILVKNKDIPVICFCLTPLRPVFDKHYRKRAIASRKGLRLLGFHIYSELFKIVDQRMWKKYDYIFFDSKETLSRAKKGGLLDGLTGKYEVLHPGVDSNVHKPIWKYKPYFFIPGRIMWTKNIQLGIRSFIKFKKDNPEFLNFKLVIAGQVDNKSNIYFEELRTISKERGDIKYIISPSDKKLRKLYSECWAVLQTSFNEDWGLTPLEGNAYGKPVIAVNRGGLKESQIDGKTGYLIEPTVREFSKKLAKLAGNLRLTRRIGINARENSKKYDWESFVKRIEEVFNDELV